MYLQFADFLEDSFNIRPKQTLGAIYFALAVLAAAFFILCCTLIIAFDDIFLGFNNIANLRLSDVPNEDIIAREEGVFTSAILTAQERQRALAEVSTVYYPPDPSIARQQRDLMEKILQYIDNVRADAYASLEQQIADMKAITTLQLNAAEENVVAILQLPEEKWQLVRDELILVLERVMRDEIRAIDVTETREQLPNKVSSRLSLQESDIVTVIAADLIRANTYQNPEQTAIDREAALDNIEEQERHFIAGQIVAPANQPIDALSFEALQELGMLAQTSNRGLHILRALLASLLVITMLGLYIRRFEAQLFYSDRKSLLLIAGLFLFALGAMRAGGTANVYLMPVAALGMVYVALSSPNLAIVTTVSFAFLGSLLSRSPSLEIACLIAAGNIGAILTLRNAGRLNNYFFAGLFVGIVNAAVVTIFALQVGFASDDLTNMLGALFSGLLIVPTTSFAVMYVLTVLFNLATPFKLMDLSQPSKPLLQRLLREAPGTYQHSLQVANLAEQAAAAIGADTQMTHVAALYHDIGKMSNPFFFTENQQHIHNPHDALADPYRSAHITIDHVIEGDQIAKKYKLPNRIRDFIREHHGTTQVFVFHQRALQEAGNANGIDLADFSYPGPIPQSPETAILMMADSCESAIRAVKPQNSQEIADLVHKIIEGKRSAGQLDASNLTLNDLRKIEETFVEIFRGLFHPRIDYAKAVQPGAAQPSPSRPARPPQPPAPPPRQPVPETVPAPPTNSNPPPPAADDNTDNINNIMEDEEPFYEVPPLPKRNGKPGAASDAVDASDAADNPA